MNTFPGSSSGFEPRATSHERQRSGAQLAARGSWLFLALTWCVVLSAQRSPFNNLEVLPADSTGHYRILIGGHFHGESTNRSGYPAATLLANLDTINSLGANLFLSTGDLFMDPVNDLPRYQASLFSKLKMPLFNAPGNHDDESGPKAFKGIAMPVNPVDRAGWEACLDSLRRFGQDSTAVGIALARKLSSHMGYTPATDGCCVLNTEIGAGTLDTNQLGKLDRISSRLSSRPDGSAWLKRLFIISHRPIWSEDDPQYSDLFEGNTRSVTGTNFQKDVYPLLVKIAKHAHVYWISGSVGGSAPSSIFFQEHAKNITYIQCAIRDEPRDALLIADVYPDTVKWSSFSLTGKKLLAPETYNASWWREHIGKSKGFNWRLLPYLVKTTVLRKEFWWGVLGGMLALMLIRRFIRR